MQLFYAKNCSENRLIFEKWDHIENCQKWVPSKGYSLCKIVTLAQKLKMQKHMLKRFVQHIAVVLCKKRLKKRGNIPKMRPFLKLPKMATKQNWNKIVSLAQKLKMQKNMLKTFLQHIVVVLCKKNGSKNRLIFEKWDYFENCQKWPPSKGYSVCKIVTLAQKLKMQKICLQRFYHTLQLFYAKNGLKKEVIFQKWDHF